MKHGSKIGNRRKAQNKEVGMKESMKFFSIFWAAN